METAGWSMIYAGQETTVEGGKGDRGAGESTKGEGKKDLGVFFWRNGKGMTFGRLRTWS